MAHQYIYRAQLMGTTVILTLFESNRSVATAVFSSLTKLESLLTVNGLNSEVMAINQAAGLHPVTVSPLVFELINYAKQASLLPRSVFNLAIGPLVKLWRIGFKGQTVPKDTKIQECLRITDPNFVELNPEMSTVYLKKKNMALDLGAIAKGYAADIVNVVLDENGVSDAMIDLGGNVLAKGQSFTNEDNCWHVGLQKPFAERGELLGMIKIVNKSIVTSGIYERFFMHRGKRYHHIFDPRTGYPLDNDLESVSIISEASLTGDVYSTIIYGLGLMQGLEYLSHQQMLIALFVTKDKRIICSDKLHFDFVKLDAAYSLWYFDKQLKQITLVH